MSVYCQKCDHLRVENGLLKADLAVANKQIGWLKEDKIRLNKSIRIRDNGFDALIDINEKELAAAKAQNQSFGNVLAVIHRDGGHYITKHGHEKASEDAIKIVLDLRKENDRLKEFARPVIRQECWSIFEQDGLDIHDLAEKLGLIVPCTATEEDVDETIFIFSETLKESD